jgi:hypothetical protein
MLFLILISLQKINFLAAQNLIKNPNFEILKPQSIVVPCDFTMFPADFGAKIETWTSFQRMTLDINKAGETCDLFPKVQDGTNCVGIVTYLPSDDLVGSENFREIIIKKNSYKKNLCESKFYILEKSPYICSDFENPSLSVVKSILLC